MSTADRAIAGAVTPRSSRWRRIGIGALRLAAWTLLLVGVWTIPFVLAWAVLPHGVEEGVDPMWPWVVTEIVVATLGLSMTTWWVADWLDEPADVDGSLDEQR